MAAAAADGGAESQDLTDTIMEYQRREHFLLARMARGEREMRCLRRQAAEAAHGFRDMRKDSLKDATVDPVVNIEIAMLRQRLELQNGEIERIRQDLRNTTFHPSRIQGQKLLTKCAHLMEENSELGRQLGEERLQTLRIQLCVERKKKQQLEQRIAAFDGMAEQIDAENERMQTRIADLGQKLKECRGEVDRCKKEVGSWKSGARTGKKRKSKETAGAGSQSGLAGAASTAEPAKAPAAPVAAAAASAALAAPADAAAATGAGEKPPKKHRKIKA